VRITFSGRRDWRVPKKVLTNMKNASALTEKNKALTLNIAFNYGGRAEIVDAVAQLVADKVPANKIDEKALRARLYHRNCPTRTWSFALRGVPDLEFLALEMAYSELVFTDVLWPDFRRENLFEAVEEYQQRERRFGVSTNDHDQDDVVVGVSSTRSCGALRQR